MAFDVLLEGQEKRAPRIPRVVRARRNSDKQGEELLVKLCEQHYAAHSTSSLGSSAASLSPATQASPKSSSLCLPELGLPVSEEFNFAHPDLPNFCPCPPLLCLGGGLVEILLFLAFCWAQWWNHLVAH